MEDTSKHFGIERVSCKDILFGTIGVAAYGITYMMMPTTFGGAYTRDALLGHIETLSQEIDEPECIERLRSSAMDLDMAEDIRGLVEMLTEFAPECSDTGLFSVRRNSETGGAEIFLKDNLVAMFFSVEAGLFVVNKLAFAQSLPGVCAELMRRIVKLGLPFFEDDIDSDSGDFSSDDGLSSETDLPLMILRHVGDC